MTTLEIESKTISIFDSENTGSPLVILNTYGNEGSTVWDECQNLNCQPFSLAAISNLNWNSDMSPWNNPPIYKNDDAFEGKADDYLSLLTEKIIPAAINSISGTKPAYIALAGYSLAGLLALYAAHKTDCFARIASASGSLWFPGFTEYVESNDFIRNPEYIYLSLGDTEAKARNQVLSTVQDNTEKLYSYWSEKGIAVKYELNKGNHFTDAAGRMARGIKWILEQ